MGGGQQRGGAIIHLPAPALSLCWWVSASVSSAQTIPTLPGLILGEHSPEISTQTNYSQISINQERVYQY